MARLSAILLAAALLVVGRLAYAAPSKGEVFWRAVLPGAAVPDAIISFLHPDNHFISIAKTEGSSDLDSKGPNNRKFWPFVYQDGKHSSATPAGDHGAAEVGDFGSLDSSKGTSNRKFWPFVYQDGKHSSTMPAGDHGAAEVGDSGSLDSNKGSSNCKFWPFVYQDGKHSSTTPAGDHGAAEVGDSGDLHKRHHHVGGHVAVSASQGSGAATTTTMFFHAELLRIGERLLFDFPAAVPAALGLLPRTVADSIPFATDALPQVLTLFGVSPGSTMAVTMAETLRACELPPLAGEATRFCATSLEALVEGSMAATGTQDIQAVTSTLPRDGAPLQLYTVRAVRPVENSSFVACHNLDYPYTVYGCHGTGPARTYMMELEGARGGVVTVAAICHTDTSYWSPEHVAFKVLGTKPGGAPVCHVLLYGDIIWVRNPKVSPA